MAVLPRQHAAPEGRGREDPQAEVVGHGNDLLLDAAVQKRVFLLGDGEQREPHGAQPLAQHGPPPGRVPLNADVPDQAPVD